MKTRAIYRFFTSGLTTRALVRGLVYCGIAAVAASCSDIDEADRLKVVSVVEVNDEPEPEPETPTDYFTPYQRHVLIEDFTGQDCVNCPNATDLIATMQAMNGHDNVVAVGIHSGPLGVKPTKNPEGLASDLGDTYYDYWKIQMQPYGVIDRSDGILATDWWTAKVNWDLALEQWPATQVNVWVEAEQTDGNQANITVRLAGMQGTATGKLQVWLTEDNITAFQKMPDGTTKADYVHNHVLRAAVNGTWGEDCSVAEQELKDFHYTYDLSAAWSPDNLAVVVFVYNDKGVLQVTRKKLTHK